MRHAFQAHHCCCQFSNRIAPALYIVPGGHTTTAPATTAEKQRGNTQQGSARCSEPKTGALIAVAIYDVLRCNLKSWCGQVPEFNLPHVYRCKLSALANFRPPTNMCFVFVFASRVCAQELFLPLLRPQSGQGCSATWFKTIHNNHFDVG